MFQDGRAPPLSGPEAPRLVCSDRHPLSQLLWDRAARIPVPPCSQGPVTRGGLLGGLLHFPVGAVPMTAAPASPGPPWGLNALSESREWGLCWGRGRSGAAPSLSLPSHLPVSTHTPPGPIFFFPPSKPKTKPTSHSLGHVCFMRTREIKHSSQGLCQPGRASHSRVLTPGLPVHQPREVQPRAQGHAACQYENWGRPTPEAACRPQGYAGLGGGLALEAFPEKTSPVHRFIQSLAHGLCVSPRTSCSLRMSTVLSASVAPRSPGLGGAPQGRGEVRT